MSGDVNIIPNDFAGSRLNQAIDAAKQRGLARTAQPDHCKKLAFLNFETDIFERLRAVGVRFVEMFDCEHNIPSIVRNCKAEG